MAFYWTLASEGQSLHIRFDTAGHSECRLLSPSAVENLMLQLGRDIRFAWYDPVSKFGLVLLNADSLELNVYLFDEEGDYDTLTFRGADGPRFLNDVIRTVEGVGSGYDAA